jgi:adenosylcobalamin-dependent ribonucleoside-diphosphate reductase
VAQVDLDQLGLRHNLMTKTASITLSKDGRSLKFSEEYLLSRSVDVFYEGDDLAKSVVRSKYLHNIDNDNLALMWYREAKTLYDTQIKEYKKSKFSLLEFYEALEDFKYVFGGRINYALGVADIKGSLNNCFSGDESFFTTQGLVKFKDVVGTKVSILSPASKQFEEADVVSFGDQELNRITMCFFKGNGKAKRWVVKATSNHRWPLVTGEITENLKVGDTISPIGAKLPYNELGFIHGLVFADGNLHPLKSGFSHQLRLCGKKSGQVSLFTDAEKYTVTYPDFANGDPVVNIRSAINLKELPPEGATPDYIASFLKGWFLFDGYTLKKMPTKQLHTTNLPALNYFIEYAPLSGFIVTGNITTVTTPTNFGERKYPLHRVNFRETSDFSGFLVEKIESIGVHPVYCVVEPKYKLFTLHDGIATGNCYWHPIEHDSLYGIYHSLGTNGLTYAKGGGVGNDITILRPANSAVHGTGATSPGATSFMDIISCNTGTIAQHGRRGANLISIHCQHPDVEAFIDNKNDNFFDYLQKIEKYDKNLARDLNNDFSDRRKTSFSNVSIKFTDEFMHAVFNDEKIQLYFPDIENCIKETDKVLITKHKDRLVRYFMFYQNLSFSSATKEAEKQMPFSIYDTRWDGDLDGWRSSGYPIKVHKIISAKEVWDKFCISAWRSAEPGLLFLDTVNRNWTSEKKFRGVNPCGEILLSLYEPCNLGHINLAYFIDHANNTLDLPLIKKYVPVFIYLQDLVHDANKGRQALSLQEEASVRYRRLGCGYTALGDMLIHLGLKYDSPETILYVEGIAKEIEIAKWWASSEIAKEKGAYPAFNYKVFSKSEHFQKMPEDLKAHIKKYGMRNVATSTIAPVGTGSILTQTSSGIEPIFSTHYKRRVKQDDGTYQTFFTYPKIVNDKFGSHKNLPAYVVTAHTVSYKDRIKMQGAWQSWIDNSISSTVNLSKDATVQDVKDVYEEAFRSGLKGVSVYRDGSRAGVLIANDEANIPDGHAAKSPDRLPAQRIIRKFEGRKFYFTITLNNGSPYEVFLSTNASSSATDSDKAVEALEKLLRKHKIDQNLIDDQIKKSLHQANSVKVCRMVSMALRHDIELVKIVTVLVNLEMPVTSFIFHLGKVLSEWVPNGTTYSAGKSENWVFQNGCVINLVTGESKC